MTLRELVAAAKARQTCDWDHTADLLALMASMQSRNHYQREDFHPLRRSVNRSNAESDPAEIYRKLVEEERRRGDKLTQRV